MPKNNQKCKGYEVFQRLNYLFQIKDVMASNTMISTHYGQLISSIAKKSVLKIDPDLKRQLCKKCKSPLIFDETATVKIKRINKKPVVIYVCKCCGFCKKYPVKSDKKLWTETKESIVGVIDCEETKNTPKTNGDNAKKQQSIKSDENAKK